MQVYKGVTAQGGAAYGIIKIKDKKARKTRDKSKTTGTLERVDARLERSRFLRARVGADNALMLLREKTEGTLGEKEARIFETERMVLQDEGFTRQVLEKISDEGLTADAAVTAVSAELTEILEKNESEFFRSRCEDIYEIRDLLINEMQSNNTLPERDEIEKRHILVADNISASEMMSIDYRKVRGIVLRKGSIYSHASIIARSRHIPMIVNCNFPGDLSVAEFPAVLLAGEGKLFISPEAAILSKFSHQKMKDLGIEEENETDSEPKDFSGMFVNVTGIQDVDRACKCNAKGIGLFRSEFIYMGRRAAPSEEEQFAIYKEALIRMKGKPVVIRTADFGGDKKTSYLKEMGGARGIEYSLREMSLLTSQLRALLRASRYGNLYILLPVVKSALQVWSVLALIEGVKEELAKEGIPYGSGYKLGVMIETLNAVDCADELAKLVDFFSIGTNDLFGSVLGIARENIRPQDFNEENTSKLFDVIKETTKAAHRAGITVTVCGELASDSQAAVKLKELGVDDLSVSI